MPLTDLACRNARCPEGVSYVRLADGGGLYLEVTAAGGKLWRWKYRFGGKEKRLALGKYPEVPLARRVERDRDTGTQRIIKGARELRDEARERLQAGDDPGAERKLLKRASLVSMERAFEAVARRWWEGWRINKTARYADYVIGRLASDAFPLIGHVPVDELRSSHFIAMASRLEERDVPELARRVLQTCGVVMRWAVAHGLADRNPVADLKPSDFLKPRIVTNFARVGAAELPALLRAINAYQGSVYTRVAIQLMALTFVRTSELIQARWDEFDLERAEWTIPPDRIGRKGVMGKRRAHLVPLSRQALEWLRTLRVARGEDRCQGNALLFPGERDHERPMSNGTILMALKRMGYRGRMTGHGFRGIASTALNEMGYRVDIIEAQLSHVERDRTRAAYNHAQYLEERREMMQGWADYLDRVRSGGKVIPFRQGRGRDLLSA
jgi:integrase